MFPIGLTSHSWPLFYRLDFQEFLCLIRQKKQCVVGMLMVKDLVLVEPGNEMNLKDIMRMFGRDVYVVDDDAPLISVLTDFKKGKTHMAVVRRVIDPEGVGDPYYQHVGLITLEDILEEILQDEIIDEFEASAPPGQRQSIDRESVVQAQGFCYRDLAGAQVGRLLLLDANRCTDKLSKNEAIAVALFLSATLAIFGETYVNSGILRKCLEDSIVVNIKDGERIYSQGESTNFGFLILQGKVRVVVGSEGFESILSPWQMLGIQALGSPPLPILRMYNLSERTTALREWGASINYRSDFDAFAMGIMHMKGGKRIVNDTRLLRITREQYITMLEASRSGGLLESPMSENKSQVHTARPNNDALMGQPPTPIIPASMF
eukprot:GHVO01029563.1.p1 GENE.GHVO01029563.1~~GHVO01029563.1.p1  ORF type:complete len:377 (-),score=47.55 GHVO01029563.1:111-1241(-)